MTKMLSENMSSRLVISIDLFPLDSDLRCNWSLGYSQTVRIYAGYVQRADYENNGIKGIQVFCYKNRINKTKPFCFI